MAKRRRKLKTKKLIGTLLVLVLLGFIGWGAYYVADTIRLFNKSKTELPSDPSTSASFPSRRSRSLPIIPRIIPS